MKREELGGIGKWSRRVKELGKGRVWMVNRMGSKSGKGRGEGREVEWIWRGKEEGLWREKGEGVWRVKKEGA